MARGGLRAKTQQPGTHGDGHCLTVVEAIHLYQAEHNLDQHYPIPLASPSRKHPPMPQQIRNPATPYSATTDPLFSNANGLTEDSLIEMRLEKSEHRIRPKAAAIKQAEKS